MPVLSFLHCLCWISLSSSLPLLLAGWLWLASTEIIASNGTINDNVLQGLERSAIFAGIFLQYLSKAITGVSLSLICLKFYRLFLPTLPKNYPLFSIYSHIITYYSHIILYTLLFQVLTSRETHVWTWYIFCCRHCVNDSDVCIIGKMVNENHPCLSLNCIISYVTDFNI